MAALLSSPNKIKQGAQWLSGRVFDTEKSRVRASPTSLRCVLEQDTLSLAYIYIIYWFNP